MKQVSESEARDSRWAWLYKLSGAAALAAGILLMIGMLHVIRETVLPALRGGLLPALGSNWLTIIFKLHAGMSGADIGLLQALNALDIWILALTGTMFLGLYTELRRTSRIWAVVAAIQPWLGIVLFVATKNAGRSAVMGAALVISFVMLRGGDFGKLIGYLGIASSVLLLFGDFSAGMPPTIIVAALFGAAYALFIAWFFSVARRLLGLGGAWPNQRAHP